MKNTIYLIIVLLASGCTNENFKQETSTDLTNIDSIKTYIPGDWFVIENGLEKEFIQLSFSETDSSLGMWQRYNAEDIKQYKIDNSLPLSSCLSWAKLSFKNDVPIIVIKGMGVQDTVKIKHISKNKLILNQTVYLKGENVR